MASLSEKYNYEHIIIDNSSTDDTVSILTHLAKADTRIKIIVNCRNFGPVRSPYYGVLNAHGDAVLLMASDLQDPPELIGSLIEKWEQGFQVVLCTKPTSDEAGYKRFLRQKYYKLLNLISDIPLENNATGSGLFDKRVIDVLRKISDPYPYFRGLICDLGFSRSTEEFTQPARKKGYSKASIYGMLDQALLGMTKHSKMPLRFMTILGLIIGSLSLALSFVFFILKLVFWDSFSLGIAPLLIALFFFTGLQFFFLGILGEYVGIILTHVRGMPLVVEKERINFDQEEK
jgi:glycosyltransferase involved in cell wall biosynthesis